MSIFCTNCGAAIAEGKKFCTACGAKTDDVPKVQPAPAGPAGAAVAQPQPQKNTSPVAVMEPPRQAAPVPQPTPAAPVYPASNTAAMQYNAPSDEAPPKGSLYATISTLGYIGWMILMGLPVVGLIVAILLAFGKGPVNRRNLARAMLVFIGVATVMSIIAFLTIWPVLSEFIIIDFGI